MRRCTEQLTVGSANPKLKTRTNPHPPTPMLAIGNERFLFLSAAHEMKLKEFNTFDEAVIQLKGECEKRKSFDSLLGNISVQPMPISHSNQKTWC